MFSISKISLETSCCDHQKPFQGWCEQNLGRSDPETLDELAELDVCVSSGRFDMRFCLKRLRAMVSKPRKMGGPPSVKVCRIGTQKLSLRFDHLEYGDIVRIPVDSNWSGPEERYSTHAGLEFQEDILWIPASLQTRYEPRVPEKQNSTGSWMARHEGSSRSTWTRRWAEPSTLLSRRIPRQRSGCPPERALERQDTTKFVGCGSGRHS